jgi:hypothetical protein
MVTVTMGGRSWEVAPYKIGAMRKAAPHIDIINSKVGALSTVEGMASVASEFLSVLLVGIQKVDPSVTLEQLEDEVSLADIQDLRDAFQGVLAESGMTRAGEAEAPAAAAPVAASTTGSAESSSS